MPTIFTVQHDCIQHSVVVCDGETRFTCYRGTHYTAVRLVSLLDRVTHKPQSSIEEWISANFLMQTAPVSKSAATTLKMRVIRKRPKHVTVKLLKHLLRFLLESGLWLVIELQASGPELTLRWRKLED